VRPIARDMALPRRGIDGGTARETFFIAREFVLDRFSRSDEVGWRRLEPEYIERSHKPVHLTSGELNRTFDRNNIDAAATVSS
jgi:hypothetical protein